MRVPPAPSRFSDALIQSPTAETVAASLRVASRRPTTTARGIHRIASDLGASRVAIILEPDALAMADGPSSDERQDGFDSIRYAVDTLMRNPATAVYVDGGHLRWHSPDGGSQGRCRNARGVSPLTLRTSSPPRTHRLRRRPVPALTNGSH